MRKPCAILLLLGGISLAHAANPSSNEAVARRVFDEIYNQGKFEAADEIYAKDFVNHGFSKDVDLAVDQAAARGWKAAIPDIRVTVERTFNDGEYVTLIWRWKDQRGMERVRSAAPHVAARISAVSVASFI